MSHVISIIIVAVQSKISISLGSFNTGIMCCGDFRTAFIEFGSDRIPGSLLRGKRANDDRYCSLRIEDSPQLPPESFNINGSISMVARTGINDIINAIDEEMTAFPK